MITKQLVDQIEGEASIYFDMKEEKVKFCTLSFPHFRGMENILKGKSALDALVITPRVCGICGHAHLMASVRAIEDAYENAGHEMKISKKAKNIREFTLVMEMIQNHFKWIYLVIIPELIKLTDSKKISTPLKGAYAASLATKAIATFAGQWPHSSYMVPGGITSDPTHMDTIKAKTYVQELVTFFEKESIGINLDMFLSFDSCKDFSKLDSDISFIDKSLQSLNMHTKGFSYDRFMVLGEHTFTKPSRIKETRPFSPNLKYVSTEDGYSPNAKTYAKNAVYRNKFYETGPLARAMSINPAIAKNMHRRFKDSAYSRVMIRIFELASLLEHASDLLSKIDISEVSFIEPIDITKVSGKGIGVVEAPRGPLIHEISISDGIINSYHIVTPTQWNIGSSSKLNPSPAQKAMIGVSKKDALFIFRTFDVCSVCTTH